MMRLVRRGWISLLRHRSTIFIGLLTVGIPFLMEIGPEIVHYVSGCGSDESPLGAGLYYHRLTRFSRFDLRDRFTRVITKSEGSEGRSTITNACVSRELDARIIDTLIDSHPRVIVLDSFHWLSD